MDGSSDGLQHRACEYHSVETLYIMVIPDSTPDVDLVLTIWVL